MPRARLELPIGAELNPDESMMYARRRSIFASYHNAKAIGHRKAEHLVDQFEFLDDDTSSKNSK